MEERLVKVGITHGDINGIGYEVILKTLSDTRIAELCTPVITARQRLPLITGRSWNCLL